MDAPHPVLRAWRDEDLERLVALHHHPDVYPWLGGRQSEAVITAIYERLRAQIEAQGWGAWVVRSEADELIGVAGLDPIGDGMPVSGIEALWRLHPDWWGRGLVTTAMRAVLADAFGKRGLEDVWTYTAESNRRSRAVMERLGFERSPGQDFDHPRLAADHPLSRHVVYRMEAVSVSGVVH